MTDLHNAIRQAPEISRGLRRWFGGDDLVSVDRLSETIYPVMDFWDHDEHPETARLSGEELWSIAGGLTAVVGEFSAAAILNESAGQIVTIDKIGVSGVTGEEVSVKQALVATVTATLAARTRCAARDLRGMIATGRVVRTSLITGTDLLSDWGGQFLDMIEAVTNEVIYAAHTPFVIGPGEAILLIDRTTANTAFRTYARGVEREARPGELSG